MKKLMTMLAAVGMAFGLFAADPDPIVDTNDFASVTQEAFSNDTQWTYNGTATKPIDKVWVANNLLNLATGSDKVQRTFVSDGAVTVTDAIYFDANINFEDPFDEAPVVTDANAKIAAFVLDNSGIIEELGDAAAVAASTNLYVIAGYYNGKEWEKRAFMFATSELEGIASKTAKRLTIKAYGDVMAGAATRMGFRFFLNGNTDIKPALAVKYVFPINEDGSIDFTTFIAADDSTTPYLGEGVKASLEAAVRSRCTDQTLVLGLNTYAGELVGFDLAGKGELANFTLTTESPAFIGGDSQTVTLALTDAQVTVTGAVDYDQTSITFAPGDPITVSATYTEGKSDIVKWTLNEVEIQPTKDSYTWTPNNGDTLAISAKAAGAYVIASDGTKTPFENLFGNDSTTDAEAYVRANGGTLQLVGDAVYPNANYFAVNGEDFTLDLAGHNFVGTSDSYASILIMAGKLTITNSTVAVGTISASVQNGLAIENNATLVIAGGRMADKVATKKFVDEDKPTTTIIGGTFDGDVTVDTGAELLTIGGNFNKYVFVEATDVPGVPDDGYDIVDTEVSGYWTVKEHVAGTVTVTFKVDGADYNTVGVLENETVGENMPANPTKTGYTFQKWVIGETETEFTATMVVTANMTVNAKFTVDTYTITIAEGGESALATPNTYTIESFNGDADLEVTLDAGTAPANKKFVSWTKNVDDTVATIAGNTLTIKNGKLANITVTANWKTIEYATLTIATVEHLTICVTNAAGDVQSSGETFDKDLAIQLYVTRTPNSGYELDGYAETETITMSADVTVTGAVKSASQPVNPGEDIKTDKTPAQINDSPELKKQLLTAPDGATVGDGYYGYFDAVNGSESGTVKFVLNATGSNTVATAEAEANADALEAVLAATTGSKMLEIATPVAGFYYSLKQSGVVTTLDFNDPGDANKLATGKNTITFALVKPENAGFYQTIVTPVPVNVSNGADD